MSSYKTLLLRCLVTFLTCLGMSYASAQNKRILIVSTNTDSVGLSKSGSFLREIAYPFKQFMDNGYQVDIVTPKGGAAAIYQREVENEDLIKIRDSEAFIIATEKTLRAEDVRPGNYVAVFYPGGHGQYFDVIDNERISGITAAIYENGGVIGTAGHGAASLINIRLSDCTYLVANKSMTCFPLWAEKKFMNISDFGKRLAFDMQDVLARRGAILSVCTFETYGNKDINQIVDSKNRLVTGAFANSAAWVAEQMVALLRAK